MKIRFNSAWQSTLDKNKENHYEGNKLRFYRLFKQNFSYETYLSEIKNPDHRTAITRLWTSTHKLHIEAGRYTATPAELRVCNSVLLWRN